MTPNTTDPATQQLERFGQAVKRGPHVYNDTTPKKVVQQRRTRNKKARQARRAARR